MRHRECDLGILNTSHQRDLNTVFKALFNNPTGILSTFYQRDLNTWLLINETCVNLKLTTVLSMSEMYVFVAGAVQALPEQPEQNLS
jgi:hypothetical protein